MTTEEARQVRSEDHPGGTRAASMGVLLACAAMGAAVLVGSGRMGARSLGSAADGVFAETGTLLAPAAPAYALWPVLYLGLAAYAVWQALPAQQRSLRHARLRGWAVASMLLNAAWIVAAVSGALLASVVIILALLAALVMIIATVAEACPSGRIDRLLIDGVFGLYLGWIMAMVLANTSSWLVFIGIGAGEPSSTATAWSVGAICGLVVASALLARASGGRAAPAAAVAWALAWIAQGRLAGDLAAPALGLVAAAGAVVVVAAVISARCGPVRTVRPPGRERAENLLPARAGWLDSHRRAPS
ncbi:tryptophan-rich sensory protein [Hoyosella sp. G463]|uniref:Tryptophan-rich sensory protein n=1 Tax=Lolliginicoccus lacisalsi TaxID=2742202 RepID=A0A927PJU0_9ACTN|nr:tryptophan-rich sensory protein [Lolliginicoccus lacisalsi]MBD8504933.1 tryptophan-rich sensory protein [Lolliginicoccus lacisalsi]